MKQFDNLADARTWVEVTHATFASHLPVAA
jgi:hypothetical protein